MLHSACHVYIVSAIRIKTLETNIEVHFPLVAVFESVDSTLLALVIISLWIIHAGSIDYLCCYYAGVLESPCAWNIFCSVSVHNHRLLCFVAQPFRFGKIPVLETLPA